MVGFDEPIQPALDAAQPGSTVVVLGGVHAEQLTITKDRISLIGVGAVLTPPVTAEDNTCSGVAGPPPDKGPPTQAGICVTGEDVAFGDFNGEHKPVLSVGRPIGRCAHPGLRDSGLLGPERGRRRCSDVHVQENTLAASPRYGVLSVGSRGTRVVGNTVTGGPDFGFFIGICVDDVESPVVRANDVSGEIVGLCVQTTGARIEDNSVHDNCQGIFVTRGSAL